MANHCSSKHTCETHVLCCLFPYVMEVGSNQTPSGAGLDSESASCGLDFNCVPNCNSETGIHRRGMFLLNTG